MYFDESESCMVWLFAPPKNFINTSGYRYVDFPGGLYAVCAARDGDGVDMEKTRAAMRKWIDSGGRFEESTEENGLPKRRELGHVCTPKIFEEKMGYT